MKKKVVTTLCGTMILLVGMGTGAFASSQLQEIKALLNGELKIRVNGRLPLSKMGMAKRYFPLLIKELRIFRYDLFLSCWMFR